MHNILRIVNVPWREGETVVFSHVEDCIPVRLDYAGSGAYTLRCAGAHKNVPLMLDDSYEYRVHDVEANLFGVNSSYYLPLDGARGIGNNAFSHVRSGIAVDNLRIEVTGVEMRISARTLLDFNSFGNSHGFSAGSRQLFRIESALKSLFPQSVLATIDTAPTLPPSPMSAAFFLALDNLLLPFHRKMLDRRIRQNNFYYAATGVRFVGEINHNEY